MEGVPLYDATTAWKWADSDNLSAGYTTPPIQWEPSIHTKYEQRGGQAIVGSTASIPAWTPGRYAGGPCGTGGTPGWYSCTSNGRSGRIQTFLGIGPNPGPREHAIFKGTSLPAVFMSRAKLGPFTDIWAGGHDGLYRLGYPYTDSFSIGGSQYRMNYQNGYSIFNQTTSCTSFYTYDPFGNPVFLHSGCYLD